MAFAQGREKNPGRPPHGETVSLTGSLVVANGMPALQSGDATYLLGGISRLVGFVDGLKEGAQVTIEGTAMTIRGDSKLKILKTSKMTLNGKSYDLAVRSMENFNPGKRWGHMAQPRGWNHNPGPGNRSHENRDRENRGHEPQRHPQRPNFR